MPAKKDPHSLTLTELEAFAQHELLHKTIPETAAILKVDEKTVDRMKAKPAWHDLAIKAIEDKKPIMEIYARKIHELADKKKQINVSGRLESVDDNVAQSVFCKEVALLYGLYPAQKYEVTAGPSDAELDKELEEAASKLPVESVEVREQAANPDDTPALEGTVL
jgi:hypothetical protein